MQRHSLFTQRGITLLESLATLGIMSAVAVGTAVMSNQYTEDTRTTAAAEHMRAVAEATRLYARDHRAALISQATDAVPAMISVSTLSGAGYLPVGFSSANAFRQNVCSLALETSAGSLNVLTIAEGGQLLDDVTLSHFSSLMGSGGGGNFSVSPDTLQGAGGGWSMQKTAFSNLANTSGKRCDDISVGAVQIEIGTPVFAQWMSASDIGDPGFLSRNVVPGNPDANRMSTNLDFGGNRITNLHSVVIGSACDVGVSNGEIASGPNGEVVTCVSGVWTTPGRAFWGANVASFGALPGCDATNMGETRRVSGISGLYVCNGIRWDAALNEANDFVLPKHLQVAGNANIAGSASIGGNASVGGSAYVSGHTTMASDAQVNGATNLYGSTTTHAALNANQGVNIPGGQAILSPGTLSVEAAGNLHLKPWGPSGQVVIGGSGGNGNLTASGRITANGSQALTANSNDWALMARNGSGSLNSTARNSSGSINANDIYLRSKGQWASDLGGIQTRRVSRSFTAFRWAGGIVSCNASEQVVGGGGACRSSIGWVFMAENGPNGNGWGVMCDTEMQINTTAYVYAICAR